MRKPFSLTLGALLVTVALATAAYAASRPVPTNQPETVIQFDNVMALPGDSEALEQALQAESPVNYKVLVIDGTEGEDRTDYLDRVAESWGEPARDTLLLVIYAEGNHDMRFYMGALFREQNVSVDEMLQVVRTHYLTKARVGDAAGGLADLIAVVNDRIAGVSTAPIEPVLPVTDRQKAEIGEQILLAYLARYQADDTPADMRIKEFRIDASKLRLEESGEDWLEYMMVFDLLPEELDTVSWMAGSGERGEDGWILSKTLFLKAVYTDGEWRLAP